MKDIGRDESVGRLLERALRSRRIANSTDDCPDADTLAAWSEGVLTAGELAGVEAHAADCARCQAHLAAILRMMPAEPPQSAIQSAIRNLQSGVRAALTGRWLVPVTAAAAALALWIWVQPRPVPATHDSAATRQARTPDAESSAPGAAPPARAAAPPVRADAPMARAAEPSPRVAAPPAIADASPPALQEKSATGANAAERRREQSADSGLGVRSSAPAAAPAAPASATAAARAPAFADLAAPRSLEIVSPDPVIRWRASGSVIQRSTDAGATWQPQSSAVDAVYTAGASPQPSVCWLVGRRGVVLLSADGQTWRRLSFPEAVDLVAITASSASSASVTTADGRVLTTADAGATWAAVP